MEITMSEAISILSEPVIKGGTTFNQELEQEAARRLGAECLKRIKAARAGPYYGILTLLPGEKKE